MGLWLVAAVPVPALAGIAAVATRVGIEYLNLWAPSLPTRCPPRAAARGALESMRLLLVNPVEMGCLWQTRPSG